jgi:hypothetical protein
MSWAEHLNIKPVAVLAAAVVAWILGAVWYTLLSKPWRNAVGAIPAESKTSGLAAHPVFPFVVSFLAEVVMALFIAALLGHLGLVTIKRGAELGFGCWAAFVATTTTVNNAYPGRKVKLTLIDAGHWLLVLIAEGVVIGAFGTFG